MAIIKTNDQDFGCVTFPAKATARLNMLRMADAEPHRLQLSGSRASSHQWRRDTVAVARTRGRLATSEALRAC